MCSSKTVLIINFTCYYVLQDLKTSFMKKEKMRVKMDDSLPRESNLLGAKGRFQRKSRELWLYDVLLF